MAEYAPPTIHVRPWKPSLDKAIDFILVADTVPTFIGRVVKA